MKLFKFKEDVRPAYFGTWTKSSKAISARRPLARDETLLSYDYDSEAEWEEDPDDAENIESEVEAEDESEDDLDGWLGELPLDTSWERCSSAMRQPATMSRSRWRKATRI